MQAIIKHVESTPAYRTELRKAARAVELAAELNPAQEHALMLILLDLKTLLETR